MSFLKSVKILLISFLLTGLFFITSVVYAEEFRWNKENWNIIPHPKVVSFYFNEEGEVFGTIADGTSFRQVNIINNLKIRIQKFEMQDYYHYILDGEVVYNLQELSKIIAKKY